jgi:hypothetical protein
LGSAIAEPDLHFTTVKIAVLIMLGSAVAEPDLHLTTFY